MHPPLSDSCHCVQARSNFAFGPHLKAILSISCTLHHYSFICTNPSRSKETMNNQLGRIHTVPLLQDSDRDALKTLDIKGLGDEDLGSLRKQDTFLYYSIPGTRCRFSPCNLIFFTDLFFTQPSSKPSFTISFPCVDQVSTMLLFSARYLPKPPTQTCSYLRSVRNAGLI